MERGEGIRRKRGGIKRKAYGEKKASSGFYGMRVSVLMGFGQLSKATKTLCITGGKNALNNNLDCPTNVVIVRLNK